MRERQWEIGICGTFDVANYGDLLFPLIAEAELAKRLGSVTLHRFSYYERAPPDWPFAVTSVTALPEMIRHLDGLLIGGGFLIRFDKDVANGYAPPTPAIHHPTGYWLTPALIALHHNVPVMWNAPGTDGNDVPAWANPLIERVLTQSRYIAVRDEQSRQALAPLTSSPVITVPDTAFGLSQLLDIDGTPSPGFTRVCETYGLRRPYIVVQAALGLEGLVGFLKKHSERLRHFQILALPIGPVLGDCQERIDAGLPGTVRLAEWPGPLLIAELIGRSEAVVGQSYHLCITALVSGVPVFTGHNLSGGKYSVFQEYEGIFGLPPSGEPDLEWFLARIGRQKPSTRVCTQQERLGEHWNRIAAEIQAGPAATAPVLDILWQSLPGLLENAARHECGAAPATPQVPEDVYRRSEAALTAARLQLADTQIRLDNTEEQLSAARQQVAEQQDRLDDLIRRETVARAETSARDARIAEIMASLSWRVTAPLRFIGGRVRKEERRMINLEYIRHHRLESDPYEWAAIHNLFTPDKAARLAATYPCDHFKVLAKQGGDGERYWEYEARALIAMGGNAIMYPDELSDEWRTLALDFLSPEYRAAMSTLTGRDLTKVPVEVNVFHYGPGGSLSSHQDLPEKLVTHVLYFNRSWNGADGGCLRILRSSDLADVAAEIPPIVGHSAVIVRSENSWHAVSRVIGNSTRSRRSVTVTFYRPGSVSTMWPPGDTTPLHRYDAADLS